MEFAIKRGNKLKYASNYYPQGNGLAESTNKNSHQNHKKYH